MLWFLLLVALLLVLFGFYRHREALAQNRTRLASRVARAVARQADARVKPSVKGPCLELYLFSPVKTLEELGESLRSHPNLLEAAWQGFRSVVLIDGDRRVEISKNG